MTKHFNSILSRIIWLHVLVIAIAAVAMPVTTYFLLNATANEFENHTLQTHANTIAQYLQLDASGHWRLNLPADLQIFYTRGFDGFSYSIIDASKKQLFTSRNSEITALGLTPSTEKNVFLQRRKGKIAYYTASIPKKVGSRIVWVEVAQNLEHPDVIFDDIVANYLNQVGWFTIPIMMVLLFADIFIISRALRPISRASELAQAIAPNRIDLRLPTKDAPRELLPLLGAINEALDRLENGFRVQREFTADAAHELRTPLTVLRTRVETLPDQEAVAALKVDLEVMSHVVSQLLEVAELENVMVDMNKSVDLRDICGQVIVHLAPIAIEQGKEVALTGCSLPVWVKGNAQMLFQAIRNLGENALRHTPLGTTVEISVEKDGTVHVLDEGLGVSPNEREIIFRRFWRRDRSRNDGAGLGLSIVSRIAESHAGNITVVNRRSGGADFTLSLALSDAAD